MRMKLTSLRLPEQTVAQLRTLAHVESLKRGCDISWSGLIREAVEQRLMELQKHECDLPLLTGDSG